MEFVLAEIGFSFVDERLARIGAVGEEQTTAVDEDVGASCLRLQLSPHPQGFTESKGGEGCVIWGRRVGVTQVIYFDLEISEVSTVCILHYWVLDVYAQDGLFGCQSSTPLNCLSA